MTTTPLDGTTRRTHDGTNPHDLARWCSGTYHPDTDTITFHTRAGEHTARRGDVIVNAVHGRGDAFYIEPAPRR